VILPCLSMVWNEGDVIYFFVQMQQPYEVFYASVHRIEGEWKVG
jgi:hypothetical protein